MSFAGNTIHSDLRIYDNYHPDVAVNKRIQFLNFKGVPILGTIVHIVPNYAGMPEIDRNSWVLIVNSVQNTDVVTIPPHLDATIYWCFKFPKQDSTTEFNYLGYERYRIDDVGMVIDHLRVSEDLASITQVGTLSDGEYAYNRLKRCYVLGQLSINHTSSANVSPSGVFPERWFHETPLAGKEDTLKRYELDFTPQLYERAERLARTATVTIPVLTFRFL